MRQSPSPAAMFSSLMYQIALSLAALAGVAAYASGLSMEASLLRVVMVLLVSTVVCYAANASLLLSQIGRAPAEVVVHLPPSPAVHHTAPEREIEVETRNVKPVREIELEARRVDAPAPPTDRQVDLAGHPDSESAD